MLSTGKTSLLPKFQTDLISTFGVIVIKTRIIKQMICTVPMWEKYRCLFNWSYVSNAMGSRVGDSIHYKLGHSLRYSFFSLMHSCCQVSRLFKLTNSNNEVTFFHIVNKRTYLMIALHHKNEQRHSYVPSIKKQNIKYYISSLSSLHTEMIKMCMKLCYVWWLIRRINRG